VLVACGLGARAAETPTRKEIRHSKFARRLVSRDARAATTTVNSVNVLSHAGSLVDPSIERGTQRRNGHLEQQNVTPSSLQDYPMRDRSNSLTARPAANHSRTTAARQRCRQDFLLLLLVSMCGCGSRATSGGAPEPVPECQQYENALASCFHRDVPFVSQATMTPKSDADRERIRTICAANLQRITTACR
jgi:hypothetical protein